MEEPNLGANIFQYDAQFGWVFFPLGQGDGCAQLDWMDLGKG